MMGTLVVKGLRFSYCFFVYLIVVSWKCIDFWITSDTSDKNEISRWLLGSVVTPFLNIGFNLAILHSSGKVDKFIDNIIVSQRKSEYLCTVYQKFGWNLVYPSSFTGFEAKQNLFENLFRHVRLQNHWIHCMKSWRSSVWLFR